MVQEISQVLGDKTEITMEDVEKMTIMENLVRETLRVHAPITLTVRQAVKEDIVGGTHWC